MGVRFDWQIETENVVEGQGVDRSMVGSGRRQLLMLLTVIGVFVVLIAGVVAAVVIRLNTVDNAIRENLLETVQAEVTALRIGDPVAFIDLQRSADIQWARFQTDRFRRYQTLKEQPDFQITGKVVDVEIDNQRGRVTLEEIVENTPNHTIWFYWRYADGWRHVPSDYTFWGAPAVTEKLNVEVQYRAVDTDLANLLAGTIDSWIDAGCKALDCSIRVETPRLQVRIIAEPYIKLTWDSKEPSTIILPSPLATGERMRVDLPLSLENEDSLARMVSEWLFDHVTNKLTPDATADAAWLREAIINWLAGTFTRRPNALQTQFIQSLRDNYGDQALAGLVQSLNPRTDINVISVVLNEPLEGLKLDWSAFFQWRLEVEKTLLSRGDPDGVYELWDTDNATSQSLLQRRITNPTQPTAIVRKSLVGLDQTGATAAQVDATIDGQPIRIFFRLVNGTWKRSG